MISLRYAELLPGPVREEFESMVAQLRGLFSVSFNEDGSLRTGDPTLGLVPVATVMDYAGTSAPTGWLLCDGSQVSRVTYKGLFEVIGTTYGVGDGSTTFNVPDGRQRFTLHKAAAGTGATLGATGGAIDHVHTGPSHTHSVSGSGGQSTNSESSHTHSFSATSTGNSTSTFNAGAGTITAIPSPADHTHDVSGTTGAGSAHSHTIDTHDHGGVTGSGGTGNTGTNNPSFLVLNQIIYTGVEA
jgi:microcystin-dependent protein